MGLTCGTFCTNEGKESNEFQVAGISKKDVKDYLNALPYYKNNMSKIIRL